MLWGHIPRGNGGRVAAVLLVDNAAQPMQAAPVAALKGIAVSGNASKLHVIFTHFDQVKGDNLPAERVLTDRPGSRSIQQLDVALNLLADSELAADAGPSRPVFNA